ncbi:hypothetical protein [Erythrobacter sp. F6033]|uniref:hypothetical protein n=1 Tax=Erythrobacter sp. F6033 TaxID=2926401 RepID=UPI001FF6BE0D|nr:hypothetical protein [Erythrobacter sp. F6033]MCK0129528.1 hypothetical protein [Erythrobacter sp. F6033]
MPSSIPYDPSLVLGTIVDKDTVATLRQHSETQSRIDVARDHMNALLRMKMSLDMTQRELASLGCETDEIDAMIASSEQQVRKAAESLAKEILKAQS